MTEHENGTIRTVVWSQIFPWLRIVGAFRLAIAARCLVFGAIGLLLTASGWALVANVFSVNPPASCSIAGTGTGACPACPWTNCTSLVPDRPALLSYFGPDVEYLEGQTAEGERTVVPVSRPGDSGLDVGAIALPWTSLTEPALRGLANRDYGLRGDEGIKALRAASTPEWVNQDFGLRDAVAILLDGIWAAAVWALFGAAICRTAATKLAADEQIGSAMALRFAWRKWPSYFAAPLLPVGGVLFLALLVLVLGWLMKFSAFLFIGAFFWPLALAAGLMMTLLLVGVLFGWPLMWGTISAEGTDSFDALSRSYAYTFQRPLHYLFYAAVAGVIGWLGWLLVREFASGVVWMSYWAASWGGGAVRIDAIRGIQGAEQLTGIAWFGATLVRFFAGCVKLLAAGYLFSYFWAAAAAVYFQLRRDVDATETDEVFLDADATEPSPSLPAITNDQSGAPVVEEPSPDADKPPTERPAGG